MTAAAAEGQDVLAVIIPVHNGCDFTVRCVHELEKQARPPDAIIVVDDGSSDGTEAALSTLPVTVLHGTGDLWWSGACDLGCRYAIKQGATHLLLLNNDNAPIDPNLCSALLRASAGTAVVSAVSVDRPPGESARVWHAGGELRWSRRGISLRRAGEPYTFASARVACEWLPGTALLVPTGVFTAIGGFQAKKYPQYRGDIDFTLRANRAGFACLVEECTWVVNDKSQTGFSYARRVAIRDVVGGLVSYRSNYNVRESVPFALEHCPGRLIPWNLAQFYGRYLWACSKAWFPTGDRASRTTQPILEDAAGIDVLHVLWSGRIGGVERYVQRLVASSRARPGIRHRACILGVGGRVSDALVSDGRAVVIGARSGIDFRAFWRFARYLRRTRPDIVHVHTRTFGAQLIGMAALSFTGTRWLYSEHAPGALAEAYKFRWFYRLFRSRFTAFVSIADAMSDAMRALGVPDEKIAAVPHGLTVPLRARDSFAEQNTRTVGVVARLEEQKGLDLFLETLRIVRKTDERVRGVVVGDGSLRGDLERTAASIGGISFVGEQDDVVPWLDSFDVFLATSVSEPFGLAVLEAFARGVPVVAMPCPGGLQALVHAGGILVESREPELAAAAVLRLLGDAAVLSDLRTEALSVAATRSFDHVLDRLEAVYAPESRCSDIPAPASEAA